MAHHPAYRERRAAGSRRGGEGKASARRAARAWAAAGDAIDSSDLPSLLRGAMLMVRDGDMTPGEATAIAALARASVSILETVELEQRIDALESAAGIERSGLRRIK